MTERAKKVKKASNCHYHFALMVYMLSPGPTISIILAQFLNNLHDNGLQKLKIIYSVEHIKKAIIFSAIFNGPWAQQCVQVQAH